MFRHFNCFYQIFILASVYLIKDIFTILIQLLICQININLACGIVNCKFALNEKTI